MIKNYFSKGVIFTLLILLGHSSTSLLSQRRGNFTIPISIGYSQSSFLNNTFIKNLNDEIIDYRFGYTAGLFLEKKYIFWNINYSNSNFKLVTRNPLNETINVNHYNLDIGASFKVLHKSKHITPLVGFNYQYSYLEGNDNSNNVYSRVNTSGFMWNIQMKIRFSYRIGLLLSYRQSFPTTINTELPEEIGFTFSNKQKGYNQLGISFLLRIGGSYSIYNN